MSERTVFNYRNKAIFLHHASRIYTGVKPAKIKERLDLRPTALFLFYLPKKFIKFLRKPVKFRVTKSGLKKSSR
ncbi:MAG: hypothetical protein BA867_10255 [Desulfobacterales bacterium S5133MH16]|nr:MAG: hypothetical protein BA867_10255 [Desulfobacterales bacterium S5133MH16]